MNFGYILKSWDKFSSNYSLDNKDIEKLIIAINREQFDEASKYLRNLNQNPNDFDFDDVDVFFFKLIQFKISIYLHNDGINAVSKSKELESQISQFRTKLQLILRICIEILTIEYLITTETAMSNIFERLHKVTKLSQGYNEDSTLVKEIEASIYFTTGLAFRKEGQIHKAIENVNKSIILYTQTQIEKGYAYYILASIYLADLSNYENAISSFKQSIFFFEDIVINNKKYINESRLHKIKVNLGFCYWRCGRLNQALNVYKKALKYNIQEKRGKGIILLNMGLIYCDLGRLDQALVYSKDSLEIFSHDKNLALISKALNNIGIIHTNKGDLESALTNYNMALTHAEQVSDKIQIAQINNNLGALYQYKGDLELSFNFYTISMNLHQELENLIEEAICIFNLINLSLLIGGNSKYKPLFKRLTKVKQNDTTGNKIIKQSYYLADAIIKKSMLRFNSLSSSQLIFNEIIHEKMIKHEYSVIAHLNQCEILLAELRFSRQKQVLQEVTELINKLYQIAKEQNSFILLAQSYMLLSKISVLNLDLEKAEYLLKLGLTTSEERGYKLIERMIREEIEAQNLIIKKIKSTDTSKLTLDYLLNLTEIESFISRINTNKIGYTLESEKPRLLILFADSGIPIFSHSFSNDQEMSTTHIGAFLGAINMFIHTAFNTTGIIERISHREFTLLFLAKEKIIFCYVFKGPYQKAVKRLNTVIDTMFESKTIQNKFEDFFRTGKSLLSDPQLRKIVTEIFNVKTIHPI